MVQFMPRPNPIYYYAYHARVVSYRKPIERMPAHGILIDGEEVMNGGKTKYCCRSFPEPWWAVFLNLFIARMVGWGNFQALFESIERADVA